METDEDSFVASRASLQSRRERLARRSEQNALDTQRSGLAEPDAEAVVSSLLDGLPAAGTDGSGQAARPRRHSDTRSSANDGTSCSTPASRADGSGRICRDREYVQPKIVDQCDVVALSLIQSSSILSMEDQGSHSRCGRTLSGEGNMGSLRRTMPARMRTSLGGERSLSDAISATESTPSPMVRRTSVDCFTKIPNGETKGETPLLRRQSSFSNESTGTESKGQLGWMPGNSVLTSRPGLAAASDDVGSDRERRPPERTPSDESREERIARYKEQRRRSKQANSVVCNGSEEREISGSLEPDVVHKRWHSLDDPEQHQPQVGLRRGSSVFFDPKRQSSEDSAQLPSTSSSFSDSSFDLSAAGGKRDLMASASTEPPASELPAVRPAALKLELQPARALVSETGAATQLLPTTPGASVSDGHPLQLAATPEGKNPDLPGLSNARRNSRRRRSNMHLDVDQPEVTPTLLEVPAEAEAADATLASTSVVTRPRRRRPTDKSEATDATTRDILDRDVGQALSLQWQQLTAVGTMTAQASKGKGGGTPERCHNFALNEAHTNGQQDNTEAVLSDYSLEKQLSNAAAHVEDADPRKSPLAQPSQSVPGALVTGGNTATSEPDPAIAAGCITKAVGAVEQHSPNCIQHTESKTAGGQEAVGKSWRTEEATCLTVPATASASDDSINGFDQKPEPLHDSTAPCLSGTDEVTSVDAKTSTSSTPDTPDTVIPGGSGAGVCATGVGAVITQNKTRSEKKAAALGLILQKFEAANSGLPPAIAAAIGLSSPTSATAPPPKKVSAAKTGKIENVIKQMAGHQQEPTGGAHQPDKAHAHPSASVESLVRKFAGTGSPPASLHISLLSSTDGAFSDASTASKSTSPVRSASPLRSASPASLADVPTTGSQRSGSDRAPSPKITGGDHPAAATLSSHSSPGSQRRSPVIISSPTSPHGMQMTSGVDAFRIVDSDASSQLTDDGQHSDTASGHRPAAPVIKQLLQSPTKLQNQQPYFSTTGKKPSKAGSSPVAAITASAQVAQESSAENGSAPLDQLQGSNKREEGRHAAGEVCRQTEVVAEAAASAKPAAELQQADRCGASSQNDAGERALPEQHRDEEAGAAGAAARVSATQDCSAPTTAAAAASGTAFVLPTAEHARSQPASQDGHIRDAPQPQPFAKLRAAPTPAKSAAKSEPQLQLDPQLANILQARLKKVETKPTSQRLSGPATTHDEHKPSAKEEAVDRATQSIKDKALYFMQMQQKSQSAGDAAPARAASSGTVVHVWQQQQPAAAAARAGGVTSAESGCRTGQGQERLAESAASAVSPPLPSERTPAQPPPQHQQRKERRRMRSRRRGSLSGDERDRWQTQPVTDSEVLVAAAVVVRGQAVTGGGSGGDCPQTDSSGIALAAASAAAALPGSTSNMDEVRRLAVMTLEEKIGLFMDRSVAWACYDAEAAPTSPDRSIRHLPIDHRAAASRCRRAAWRGRFSTQPVSPKELRSALSMLGSSALAPPTALDAAFNQKIADLCHEMETRRRRGAAQLAAEAAGSKPKLGEASASAPRRSSSGKKGSVKAEPAVPTPHGSSETRRQHGGSSSAKEAGGGAVDKRGQRTARSSAGGERLRPASLHAEPSDSADTSALNGNGMSKNAALRQSAHGPKLRAKMADKPARQRPISMNGDVKAPEDSAAGHALPSSTGPGHGAVHNGSPVVRLRPHSAKASLATQSKTRGGSEATAEAAAAGRGDRVPTRSLSSRDGEGKLAVSPVTAAGHKGHHTSDAGVAKGRDTHVREQEALVTEPLTRADKSRSQPCISTMDDNAADDDLPSYMRATTSYVRKVEHLLAESDEGDDDDQVADDDRSSLDGSRRDANHSSPFQRAGAELNANRASVRRVLGARASTGAQLESPATRHNGGEPTYMRATKAMSMRDIRTPGSKAPQTTDEPAAIGSHTKRRSMDGSRNSLPARPSSTTPQHGPAADRSSSDEDDLPSYMRATKSFARKVEHLIESCDEEEDGDDETAAAARQDECSDVGERGSSARSPTARRSRTPSTHGGSDLTPSDHATRDGKQTESEGGFEPQPAKKLASQRAAASKTSSSSSLHQEGFSHPVASHSSAVVVQHKPHVGGKSGSATAQVPVVDGKRHKATAASATSARDKVHAEANGSHGTKADVEPAKGQRRSKDKHALIGGDLPSFMRATKSSLTKDRHVEPGQNSADDQDSIAKAPQQLARKPQQPPQHHRGQGSRESLCSVGATSSKAESGHLSSSESADHGHTAPIPLISISDSHVTTKPGKPSSKISSNGGMIARHSRQQIGAVGGSAG